MGHARTLDLQPGRRAQFRDCRVLRTNRDLGSGRRQGTFAYDPRYGRDGAWGQHRAVGGPLHHAAVAVAPADPGRRRRSSPGAAHARGGRARGCRRTARTDGAADLPGRPVDRRRTAAGAAGDARVVRPGDARARPRRGPRLALRHRRPVHPAVAAASRRGRRRNRMDPGWSRCGRPRRRHRPTGPVGARSLSALGRVRMGRGRARGRPHRPGRLLAHGRAGCRPALRRGEPRAAAPRSRRGRRARRRGGCGAPWARPLCSVPCCRHCPVPATGRPTGLFNLFSEVALGGIPAPAGSPIQSLATGLPPHAALANAVVVVVLAVVGLALLIDVYPRAMVVVGSVVSFLGWWLGQGFGVFGGTATDPNTGLVAMLLLVSSWPWPATAGETVPEEEPAAASRSPWPRVAGVAVAIGLPGPAAGGGLRTAGAADRPGGVWATAVA